jgi:predicted nucleic acid-binding protein
MNGRKVLVDSNILIYASRGELDLAMLLESYDECYISVITYLEIMGFDFSDPEEQILIHEFLSFFEVAEVGMDVAEEVLLIRQIKNIKTPDAIIFSTAKVLNAELMTRNTGDFSGIPGVKVVNPFA